MNITTTANAVSMSSREIADLTEKQHPHVLRDIRVMLEALGDDPVLDHVHEEKDSRGYTACFHLSRELTELLLTGYSVPLRLKVIRRLNELEIQQAPRVPQTMAEALRLAADQAEHIEQQGKQLAIAAPKVEFVDRYVVADGLYGFRQVAKMLRAKENELSQWLVDSGVMYRLAGKLTPCAAHLDAGRFEVKAGASDAGHAFTQAKFTAKGFEWIAGKWAVRQLGVIV